MKKKNKVNICDKHPNYTADSQPVTNCPQCWQAWIKDSDDMETYLKLLLKQPSSVYDLRKNTGLSKEQINQYFSLIEDQGHEIVKINGHYIISKDLKPGRNKHTEIWDGSRIISFGVVSDTHMGSVYEQLSFLHYVYRFFHKMGIKTVYHCGDLAEGDYNNRQGHIYERHKHGADAQVEYITKHYPQIDGLETKFITGNHDYTHYRNSGTNIGKMIEKNRSDMIYLGRDNVQIKLTPKCILELNHPGDGSAYAVSYSIQKYIESMTGGEKPHILFNGHHHKAIYLFYRNVHAFEAGCIQAQSDFMRSKRIGANIGAWLIDLTVDASGQILSLSQTFLPLYKTKERDYK